eukprot:7456061-Pyramimonas_sp.AAC.1
MQSVQCGLCGASYAVEPIPYSLCGSSLSMGDSDNESRAGLKWVMLMVITMMTTIMMTTPCAPDAGGAVRMPQV